VFSFFAKKEVMPGLCDVVGNLLHAYGKFYLIGKVSRDSFSERGNYETHDVSSLVGKRRLST
jgi:hypothetical protein